MLKIPIHGYRKSAQLGLEKLYLNWVRVNLILGDGINLRAFQKDEFVSILVRFKLTASKKKALALFQSLLLENFILHSDNHYYLIGLRGLSDRLNIFYSFKNGYHNIRTKGIDPKTYTTSHIKHLLLAYSLKEDRDRKEKALYYTLYKRIKNYTLPEVRMTGPTREQLESQLEKLEKKKRGEFPTPYYTPGCSKEEFLSKTGIIESYSILEGLRLWEECREIEERGSTITIREIFQLQSLKDKLDDNDIEKLLQKDSGIIPSNIQKFLVYIGCRSALLGAGKSLIMEKVREFANYLKVKSGIESIYSQWMNVARGSFKEDISCSIFQPLSGVCNLLSLANIGSAKWALDSLEREGFIKVNKNFTPSKRNLPNIYYKKIDGIRMACIPSTIEFLV